MNKTLLALVAILLVSLAWQTAAEQTDDDSYYAEAREEITFKAKFVQFRQIQAIYSRHTNNLTAHKVAWLTVDYAEKKDLPGLLVAAIILEESRVNPKARGKAGEIGLMQIHPRYWRGRYPECGESLWNIKTNVCYGTNILRFSIDKYGNSVDGARRYNGGGQDTHIYSQKIQLRTGILYILTY